MDREKRRLFALTGILLMITLLGDMVTGGIAIASSPTAISGCNNPSSLEQCGTNSCSITAPALSCNKIITFGQVFSSIPFGHGTLSIGTLPTTLATTTVPFWYGNGSHTVPNGCGGFPPCVAGDGAWNTSNVQNEFQNNDLHDIPWEPPASSTGTVGVTLWLQCSFINGTGVENKLGLYEGSAGVQGSLVSHEQFTACPPQVGIDFGSQGSVPSLPAATPIWSIWMQCTTVAGTYPSPAPCWSLVYFTSFFIVATAVGANPPSISVQTTTMAINVRVFLMAPPASAFTMTFTWTASE